LQKEAELWAEWFIQRTGIPPSSCACIGMTSGANSSGGGGAGAGANGGAGGGGGGGMVFGAPNLDGIAVDTIALDSPETLRKVFDRLVSRILKKR
jgi:hypothetical protein